MPDAVPLVRLRASTGRHDVHNSLLPSFLPSSSLHACRGGKEGRCCCRELRRHHVSSPSRCSCPDPIHSSAKDTTTSSIPYLSQLHGGDDEDIAKMESRMTLIQEGEDDEDIAMLDTPTLWSSPSCNLSPTQLSRHPRIQQTRRHCFGHNSLIRHQNGAFLDALERGRRHRRFGSGPSSRRSVDHSV
jgi:hypothetical protein